MNALTEQPHRLDVRIAQALLVINARYGDRPLIPPTAINWIAPELAEAVRGAYDHEVVAQQAVWLGAWRDGGYREALLRQMRGSLFEQCLDDGLAPVDRPQHTLHLSPEFEAAIADGATEGTAPISEPLTDDRVATLSDERHVVVRMIAKARRLPETF